MTFYKTSNATFDIHEADNGLCAVIMVPDLSQSTIGTGTILGTFDSMQDAKDFCDDWKPKTTKS